MIFGIQELHPGCSIFIAAVSDIDNI